MSGGRFDYKDSMLQSEIFGYADKPINVFEDVEISELVWDVFGLIHSYDWYASGDTSQETYLKEKKAFKQKWFESNREERVRNIVDTAINDLKKELYQSLDLNVKE